MVTVITRVSILSAEYAGLYNKVNAYKIGINRSDVIGY